jgi:hypothetical protein
LDKNDWLYESQNGFRPVIRPVITVCQHIADCMDSEERSDVMVIDFSNAYDLVPLDRLLVEIANLGVDSRVAAWVWEFLWVARRDSA